MIYTSNKQLQQTADYAYANLSQCELNKIKEGKIREIAAYCKYGYTQGSLWLTEIGLVYCNGYAEYCGIQSER